ncbi:hypothetical protein [Flavobacterium sp. WC2509]|uniref:hypothetical protein n=1 Tax=Flavobacterium sp. WC2509 TaxID=3461406 RepID=UPI004044B7F7
MWENFINSEVTYWVLLVADVVMIFGVFYGFFLYVVQEKEYDRKLAERLKYFEYLETIKKDKL